GGYYGRRASSSVLNADGKEDSFSPPRCQGRSLRSTSSSCGTGVALGGRDRSWSSFRQARSCAEARSQSRVAHSAIACDAEAGALLSVILLGSRLERRDCDMRSHVVSESVGGGPVMPGT